MLSQRGIGGSSSAEQEVARPSLELRPKLAHQTSVIIAIPVFGGLVALSLADHEVIVAILFIVLYVLACYASFAKVRITVTPDEVVVSDIFGPGPRGRAPRSAVASIHIYSYYAVLINRAGYNLRSRPYWTMSQLLDLSEALDVPLIDHRTRHGWTHSTAGTVVTRTAGPDRLGSPGKP